jgi:tetratricopeptide (TPR) repeat protein
MGQRAERHPLLSITTELKRQHGDIWLDLSDLSAGEGRHFVDAYLDTQPNRLGEIFRAAFFRHTEGHALFTVELIREMQERGDLCKDGEGYWIEGKSINWRTLPPKVEGVIEKRIERLEEGVQEMLAIASVEGEVFTVEVVARIQPWDERVLVHRLSSELDRQHRLVTAQALHQVGRQRLSRYRFRHYLFQHYLYHRLDITERAYLHEAVGSVLESLYGEQTEQVAVQLAYHFEQAGVTEKAMTYLVQAGERANRLSANEEAIRYYQQALELSKNEEVYHSILARRGKVLLELFRGKEAVDDYARLLARAQQVGNREQEVEFLLGLARAYYLVSFDDQEMGAALKTRKLYDMAQTLSREIGDKRSIISSLLPPPLLRYYWPDYAEQIAAQAHEALALSRELNDEELILESKLAILMSSSAQEIAELEGALLEELQARRDLVRLNQLYVILMITHYSLGNFARGTLYCDAGIEIAAKIGVPPVQYPTLKAMSLLGLGRYGAAWEALQQEIADDAHPFGRAFKDLGIGLYLFEVTAYEQAAAIFEQLVVQAARLRRGWLRDWAYLGVAHALVQSGQVGQPEWLRAAQALADTDTNELKRLEPLVLAPLALEIRAEMTLVEGNLGAALQQAMAAGEMATTIGYQPQLVAALEVQGRVLLQWGRPAEALSILHSALEIATKIEYVPLVWRISATQAQALEAMGEVEAAAQAWHAAAALIQQLAATIPQRELKQGFLSDPLIASILARVQQLNQPERER